MDATRSTSAWPTRIWPPGAGGGGFVEMACDCEGRPACWPNGYAMGADELRDPGAASGDGLSL